MENPDRVTYFAATDARGSRVPFGIKQKDRAKHMYVIGKTGMGKSTLLENMAIQDIQNGEGIAFIDPHGGTADKLLDYIPKERVKDVVYFAPFDLDRPIAFNVMEDVGYDKRHLVVSGLMATFKKIWVDAWSARMEYILTNTLLALLEYPGATLLGVNRMYTDKEYRKKVVENVKDPVVKDFWIKEFATYTDRYTQEATPAIQNKIGQFTGNPLIRNIIGQPESSFDIRKMMDERKILVINLSKGQVGDTNTQLLGSMLTTRIFLAAMSRADLSAPELSRLPNFFFYVDEFQNFANETFAEILSESRKYKLNLTIAHQYVEQMEEEVRDAVFGNVGTTVVFRVGPFDAEVLETVFMPEFTKEDLVNLGFAQIYLTLMIDGVGSRPFSAVTIPPIQAPARTYRKEVTEASRDTFGSPRAAIEQAIIDELTPSLPPPALARKPAASASPRAVSTPPASGLPTGSSASGLPKGSPAPGLPTGSSASGLPTGSPASGFPARSEAPRREPKRTNAPYERTSRERTRQEPAKMPSESDAPARSPERPPPAAALRSAEDLKSILRGISQGANTERQVKTEQKQESLRDTLAGILKKNETPPPVRPNTGSPAQGTAARPLPEKKPVAAEVPATPVLPPVPASTPPPVPEPSDAAASPPPFEVPEDRLRKILDGSD